MRNASTPERDAVINELLKSPRVATYVSLEWDDDGVWRQIEDFDEDAGIGFNSPVDRSEYGRIILTPQAGEVEFKVLNDGGKYSDGSGTRFEGILTRNRKVRVMGGYLIPGVAETTQTIDIMGGNIENALRKLNGKLYRKNDYVVNGSPTYFSDLYGAKYGSAKYGSSKYGINGSWVGKYDSGNSGVAWRDVTVIANSTNWEVWGRVVADNGFDAENTDSTTWEYLGPTVDGIATFSMGNRRGRIMEVGVTSISGTWSTADFVSSVTVSMVDNVEWLYKSVFYLDQPAFPEPPAPEIPRVSCRGRDAFRLALETDVNLPAFSGKTLDWIVKQIADSCGIKYTGSSIADLSAFPTRSLATGLLKPMKASVALDLVMKLTVRDDLPLYRLAMIYDETSRDNVLHLVERANQYDAVFVFPSKYYESIGDRSKDTDRQIARVTVCNDDPGVDEEEELGTQNVTTTGLKSFSWTDKANNKRVEAPATAWANGLKAQIVSETNTSMGVQILTMPTSGSFDLKVHGCKWKDNVPPTASGERTRLGAGGKNEGQTYRFVNPLLVDDTESARTVAGFILYSGEPTAKISGLKFPYPNFVLDPGDRVLVWSRFLYDDHIYRVMNISHEWSSNGGGTSYSLEDTGLKYSDMTDFQWDEGVIPWDNGSLWDMKFGPQSTFDPTDYESRRPVRFSNG